MKQARDSRNFGGRRLWQLRTVGNMIGTLFIRSYERGERVYAAMVARGFDGQARTLENLNFRLSDVLFGLSLGFIIVSVMVLNLLYL
jgi:cobalt/nickel transport system permease protein